MKREMVVKVSDSFVKGDGQVKERDLRESSDFETDEKGQKKKRMEL